MSLRQALPAALEAKNPRDCEYDGLSYDTDPVQRDLMLVNRSLPNDNTCVTVSNYSVDNAVYA